MRIYLMRHGRPVSKQEDPERPLSDEGRKDVEKIADFLQRSGVRVEEFLHSGKTRTRQTAEIMASRVNPGLEPQERAGLAPLDDVNEIADQIKKAKKELLIAGHLPHLAKLSALLITGSESVPIVNYRESSMVCLEKDETGHCSIAWMLIPELIKGGA